MNLIPTGDAAAIIVAMDNLWETFQEEITIVKEPAISVTSFSGSYVPGFGLTSNEDNFTPTSESQTFYCLTTEKPPDGFVDEITEKMRPNQVLFVKVKLTARNYILDGRKNLYALYGGRKYNIVSNEEIASMLTNTYYVFKLTLVE